MKIHTVRQADPVFAKRFLRPGSIMISSKQNIDRPFTRVMHFAKKEPPLVNVFRSVTMVDKDRFQVANPLDRFAIGDR